MRQLRNLVCSMQDGSHGFQGVYCLAHSPQPSLLLLCVIIQFPPQTISNTPLFPSIPNNPTSLQAPLLAPFIPNEPVNCPRNMLKMGVCANLLGMPIVIGTPPKGPCCAFLGGLANFEVAMCLCTALKANILGINLNIPQALSLIVNACGKKVPDGFQCA
ncbi:PREDICTED: 14 kDa proline-rich protein DC2.15-like [Nelumbo nucifera]|uniref:14 kDa proline-rich protein DC2.15-like n=1 Tax=Nelumbo nucifera TaxID=4432 RepID=A0A1U8AGW7_NELNU|nr:PREDICTED: 14 kDa proline-rich protein DC2.15-like [Nelumbo nucifera]